MEYFNDFFESLKPDQKSKFLIHLLESDQEPKSEFLFTFKTEFEEMRRKTPTTFQLDVILKHFRSTAKLHQHEIEREVETHAQRLYTHKPPLPALKDEFRKANLEFFFRA